MVDSYLTEPSNTCVLPSGAGSTVSESQSPEAETGLTGYPRAVEIETTVISKRCTVSTQYTTEEQASNTSEYPPLWL